MFQWTKEGDGRYAGSKNTGDRIGLVIGGEGKWTAELPSGDTLGVFPTLKAAKAALERDVEDPVWKALVKVVEDRPTPFLTHYKGDFYKLDRQTLRVWGGATDFLFVLRPTGTHLIPLDLGWSRREIEAIWEAYEPKLVGYTAEFYVVHARTAYSPLAQKITREKVKELLAKPALYTLQNNCLVINIRGANPETLARLEVAPAPDTSLEKRDHLRWVFESDPFKAMYPVAVSAGFSSEIQLKRSLFAVPASIQLVYKGKVVHSWERTSGA